ncbi:MAG: hypothetical protein ACO1RX_20080 [Candidatus Sericytochromatia bacterium]
MTDITPKGPFLLNRESIIAHVQENKIGNYNLGVRRPSSPSQLHKPLGAHSGTKFSDIDLMDFEIRYVGRSDKDLQIRLISHIEGEQDCDYFIFWYTNTAEEAYRKECIQYHAERGVIFNKIHPDTPIGIDLVCPDPNCSKDLNENSLLWADKSK